MPRGTPTPVPGHPAVPFSRPSRLLGDCAAAVKAVAKDPSAFREVRAALEALSLADRRSACREIGSLIAHELSGLSGENRTKFVANVKELSSYWMMVCGYSGRLATVSSRVQGALKAGASVFQGAARIPTPRFTESPRIDVAASEADSVPPSPVAPVDLSDVPLFSENQIVEVLPPPADARGFVGHTAFDFHFNRILDEGGQAVVYDATHATDGAVAVKVSKNNGLDMGRIMETWERLSAAQSKHILRPTMKPFLLEGPFPAFAMRRMHGNLQDMAERHHERAAKGIALQSVRVWERTVATCCLDIARALASLYAARDARTGRPLLLLHRDVKPKNIGFVRAAGDGSPTDTNLDSAEFLLMDFDSMIREGDDCAPSISPLFASPQLLSQWHEMASETDPEMKLRIMRPRHTDDVYALGATMCFMLTGHPPLWFRDPTVDACEGNDAQYALAYQYVHCDTPPDIPERRDVPERREKPESVWKSFLNRVRGRSPQEQPNPQEQPKGYNKSLVRIIRKAIHPDLSERYAHVDHMAAELKETLSGKEIKASHDPNARYGETELPEPPPTDRIGRAG